MPFVLHEKQEPVFNKISFDLQAVAAFTFLEYKMLDPKSTVNTLFLFWDDT